MTRINDLEMENMHHEKAYHNHEFLNSPDARAIRMMCEFQEPFTRLAREKINSTVVFFGSARLKPKDELEARIAQLEKEIDKESNSDPAAARELRGCRRLISMARYYEDARELSKMLTQWAATLDDGREFLICSGGGGGIMEAANRGASDAGGKTIGFNISLPMEQQPNDYISPDLNFEFHYFFMRKFWFMILSRALVIFPGGFGTMDEMMEMLTLIQTEKVVTNFPVILYGSSYWKSVVNFDKLIETGVIDEEDMKIFKFCDSPEEALEFLKQKMSIGGKTMTE
jgi:uncharacterized protein (TIGR00730 family)